LSKYEKCQDPRAVAPLLSRPSVRGVPQLLTWSDGARRASSKTRTWLSRRGTNAKLLRICSSRSDSAAHHENREEQVFQLATPAQIACGCAECPGCARVAGELRRRRAAESNLLVNHALNVGTPSSREAVVQLTSSRACRRTGQKAGRSCGCRGDCNAVRVHESRDVARAACLLQCTTACCLRIVCGV
jgi:hypothetical protein